MQKLFIFGLLLVISSCASNDSKTYEQDLKNLLEISGAEKAYKEVIDQMLNVVAQRNEGPRNTKLDAFVDKLNNDAYSDLLKRLVPVYKKHLNATEIQELITYYQTGEGNSFPDKQAIITNEALETSKAWGFELGQEFKAILNNVE